MNQYNDAPEERRRVYSRIAPLILAFHHENAGRRFHSKELQQYVLSGAPEVAPSSADRILRYLRQEGKLDYVVLSRTQSLYQFRSRSHPFPKPKGKIMKKVDHNDIIIDANRADEEPFRLERLDILARILAHHHETFLGDKAKVTELYDHKGCLTVNWDAEPTKEQRELVDGFWDAVFFEPETEHYVVEQ